MAPPAKGSQPTSLFGSARHILYCFSFALAFCIAASALGLCSEQLQLLGNFRNEKWPGEKYKHAIGLLLFTSIWTLLVCLLHWGASIFIGAFATFIAAVFWGTGAGIVYSSSPMRADTCGQPVASFPPAWQPYADKCQLIVALQGLAWANWALLTMLFFAILYDSVSCHVVRTEFYNLPSKGEKV